MLRLRWRAAVSTAAPGLAPHQSIARGERQLDEPRSRSNLVDEDDRDDVFQAGGVLVGHGCAKKMRAAADPAAQRRDR